MEYINLTPHTIALNDGREFQPSGIIARAGVEFSAIVNDVATSHLSDLVFVDKNGNSCPIPQVTEGTRYIVSAMIVGERDDFVAPATGHPEAVRNEKGHIVSVPCFTRPQ